MKKVNKKLSKKSSRYKISCTAGIKYILNDKGSLTIEAAIVFPVVFIILAILMTITIYMSDNYIVDTKTSQIIHDEVMQDDLSDVKTRKKVENSILQAVNRYTILKDKNTKVVYKPNNIEVLKDMDIPFINNTKQTSSTTMVKKRSGFDYMKTIELGEDIFDYLKLSDKVRLKFNGGGSFFKKFLTKYL